LPFWHKTKKPSETWLVVGLGNPGTKYARNHHNIGFMCADAFASAHGITMERNRGGAKAGQGKINGKDVVIAKPQTFMNLSGEAVQKLFQRYHVKPANLIVIHDDMDLPPGKLRIRQGGGSAGHNGIKSIIANIGTEDFIRVRMGIGRPNGENSDRGDVIDHVLGDFTAEEQNIIDKIIPEVIKAIDTLLAEDLTAAMNKFNRTDLSKASSK
jgi:peptidyl-tRNA hydrolase, PTH1 family